MKEVTEETMLSCSSLYGIFLKRAMTPTNIDSAIKITAIGISTTNNPTTIITEIPKRVRQDSLKFNVMTSP